VPRDYSRPKGYQKSAIVYSFFGAMNPAKKESAYLHIPTYTAGLLYHFGTFISIFLFFTFISNFHLNGTISWILIFILGFSCLSGLGILLKRIAMKKLKFLSSPDDYISNVLVTLFQLFSLCMLFEESFVSIYFLIVSLLLLYIPIGKLKHMLYFFVARYQLGLFYGRRGIWPSGKM
jgi:hypothetical protein